jgi:hypothetical protein
MLGALPLKSIKVTEPGKGLSLPRSVTVLLIGFAVPKRLELFVGKVSLTRYLDVDTCSVGRSDQASTSPGMCRVLILCRYRQDDLELFETLDLS